MTVYPVIVEPPSDVGAVHDTTLCAFAPLVAETLLGTPGNVYGVAVLDAVDALPVPPAFSAVTVNVYDSPFVRLETVHVVAGVAGAIEVVEHDPPPELAVTVYLVIGQPPSDPGALHETSTD